MSPKISDNYQKQLFKKIVRDVHRTRDIEMMKQQAAIALGQALRVSRCVFFTYDRSRQSLSVAQEYRESQLPSMLGVEIQLSEWPHLTEAIATLEPVVVTEPVPHAPLERHSMLVVPTSYQEQPNGLIGLHPCESHRRWTVGELEFLEDLAQQIGSAIAYATLHQELQEARQQVSESSRLKQDFLATISHEFRTPLNHIIGSLQLILDDMIDDSSEQREFIHQAHHSALHFLEMINHLLDFNKIKLRKISIKEQQTPINLTKLLKDVEQCSLNQIESKYLNWQLSVPSSRFDIFLYGNYRQLLQAILNVVGNAIKFTPQGKISMSVELLRKKIIVDKKELPGFVQIRVSDTGIGVPMEYQSRLFEPFFRVHEPYTSPYGGTGLGLALSKKLIEGMGGEIDFYSMGEGLGSTVSLRVPLYQDPITMSRPLKNSSEAKNLMEKLELTTVGDFR